MSLSIKSLSLSVLCVSLGLTGCQSLNTHNTAAPTVAAHGLMQTQSHYGHARSLTINKTDYPVSETSARLLVNNAKTAPELVADIFDGKAQRAVPGYQLMVMNRTSSVAAEARTLEDGRVMDNRMIHRGSKALIGIPVTDGKAQLDQAQLLSFDVIYDDPTKALPKGEALKPRGTKLTKRDTPVTDQKVTINSLTLPNFVSGETSGGGIDYSAEAIVDGKLVTASANSSFDIFYTTTPETARGF
ncbi:MULTISPECIES: hypothetical protein [unclassified Psychrobacter]|uniref:hypothetical protein n=1 Tax=unclassified Psychrobacter TaxID=196806 RepID=UPI0018F2F38C|nr:MULTISPECIES: hypothetical protein [unclassified Psychrobacter]